MEFAMRNKLGLSLVVGALVWCTSGWSEEKQLDPGVINEWMRSVVTSDSDGTEIKRIVHSTTMENWSRSTRAHNARYEFSNVDCIRSLTFYRTDEHGRSPDHEWVKLIERDLEQESSKLEQPRVFVQARSINPSRSSAVMELSVEYQLRDGFPALVAKDQQDVLRTLREFKRADVAELRVMAFDLDYSFYIGLKRFANKAEWSEEHCPHSESQESGEKEESVLSPASS